MADLAAAFNIIASNAPPALLQLAGVVCQKVEPLSANGAACDFRVEENEQTFVASLQAFTRWDERVLWTMLAKSSALSERERAPTLCLLYVLLPVGYRTQGGQFRLRVGASPTQALWFREICLWERPPEPWWEMFPGLMTLYPLSAHKLAPPAALTLAAEKIHRYEKDPRSRATLQTLLGLLASMRYPDVDVVGVIGKERMKDSPLYEELLAEGGLVQCREDIVRVIQLRFGEREAKQCRKLLAEIADPDRLHDIFGEAVTCRKFEQLRKSFAEA